MHSIINEVDAEMIAIYTIHPVQSGKFANKLEIYLSEPFLEKLCVPSKTLYDKAADDLKQGLNLNSDLAKNVTASTLTSDYTAMGGLINTNFINADKIKQF